jgi:hypothetical protein
MATTKTKPAMVEATNACVITVGARPVEWQRRIVRDRHSGRLADIEIHELPPVDEGDLGRSYVFTRGERIHADHEAVLDGPGCFRPADD